MLCYLLIVHLLIPIPMYTIRDAGTADAESICYIAEQAWWEAAGPISDKQNLQVMLEDIYSSENISHQIKSGIQHYLLLIECEMTVGFAAYSPEVDLPGIYKLHKLYCLPNTQGKGFVKILIREVISKVAEAGKHRLELNVNRLGNTKDFYEKMGFHLIEEQKSWSTGTQTNMIMYLEF